MILSFGHESASGVPSVPATEAPRLRCKLVAHFVELMRNGQIKALPRESVTRVCLLMKEPKPRELVTRVCLLMKETNTRPPSPLSLPPMSPNCHPPTAPAPIVLSPLSFPH